MAVVCADDTSSQASSEDSFLSYMDEETAFNDLNMGGGPIYAITHDFEDKNFNLREIFATFSIFGNHVRYGASIARHIPGDLSAVSVPGHFDTAQDRYMKCPVYFTLTDDEMQQCDIHYSMEYMFPSVDGTGLNIPEALSDAVFNNIKLRKKGQFQIKGERIAWGIVDVPVRCW